MIPRSVVTLVVLVALAIVAVDVGAQFIPGSEHTANPLIDGPLVALIAAVITGAKGPKPETAPPPDSPAPPPLPTLPAPHVAPAPPPPPVAGRHHRSEGPS